ncbi:MAG: hypothetical protein H7145_09320 [Akkermansiaceae bacterium]|nr:hypothetical protein [Armatimonadota bacterium]
MSFGRLSPRDEFDWEAIACPGCGARLRTWADSIKGCCALCRHAFPEEFNWVHVEAVEKRRNESEQAHLEAAARHLQRHEEALERICQAGTADYLSGYIHDLSGEESTGEGVSRRELIVLVRSRTGASWRECRDFVDGFLADNPTRMVAEDGTRVKQVVHDMMISSVPEPP